MTDAKRRAAFPDGWGARKGYTRRLGEHYVLMRRETQRHIRPARWIAWLAPFASREHAAAYINKELSR